MSREAKSAFEELKSRYLGNRLRKLFRDDFDKVMEDILDDEWPSENMEYVVMRHRPMKELHEDFIDDVVDEYINWKRDILDLVD